MVLGVASFLVPWLLQLAGVVPASYLFGDGGFLVRPQLVELPEWGVHVTLILASLALVVPFGTFIGKLRDEVEQKEEALFLQAWTLRQLLPEEVARQTQ